MMAGAPAAVYKMANAYLLAEPDREPHCRWVAPIPAMHRCRVPERNLRRRKLLVRSSLSIPPWLTRTAKITTAVAEWVESAKKFSIIWTARRISQRPTKTTDPAYTLKGIWATTAPPLFSTPYLPRARTIPDAAWMGEGFPV